MNRSVSLLRKAREVLKRDGWIQGELHFNGQHCAIGAIEQAFDETTDAKPDAFSYEDLRTAKIVMGQVAGELDPKSARAGYSNEAKIASFNDRRGRTMEEVLRLFNDSIRRVKEGV